MFLFHIAYILCVTFKNLDIGEKSVWEPKRGIHQKPKTY